MRLIDADALKEDILGLRDCDNGFSDTYDKACIIDVIDEQPTAEPERKKGKWMVDPLRSTNGSAGGVHRMLRCSECGHQEPWPWLTRRYFCPNCGADMRGEKDGGR